MLLLEWAPSATYATMENATDMLTFSTVVVLESFKQMMFEHKQWSNTCRQVIEQYSQVYIPYPGRKNSNITASVVEISDTYLIARRSCRHGGGEQCLLCSRYFFFVIKITGTVLNGENNT